MSNQSIVTVITSNNAAPVIFTRAQIKQQISELKSAAIHALSSASNSAARESFVTTCCAIAVQRAVFGSDEIYQNIRRKALTLPDYKTNKVGFVIGKLGKLLHGYGEAVAVGKALSENFPMSQDDCDLSPFANSVTFGALIEAPKHAEVTTKALQITTRAETTPKGETWAQDIEPFNGNDAAANAEHAHDAAWAAYGDALAYAMKQARDESAAPSFVDLFGKLADSNEAQAIETLKAMADRMGFKLVAKRATVKKSA